MYFLAPWPSDGSIRIKDYYNSLASNNTAIGAVEIFHLGVWGGICHPNLALIAIIACKQLGYTVGYQRMQNPIQFTYRKMWINQMQCASTDTKLTDCQFSYGLQTTAEINNCRHRYQVECIREYTAISSIIILLLVELLYPACVSMKLLIIYYLNV